MRGETIFAELAEWLSTRRVCHGGALVVSVLGLCIDQELFASLPENLSVYAREPCFGISKWHDR